MCGSFVLHAWRLFTLASTIVKFSGFHNRATGGCWLMPLAEKHFLQCSCCQFHRILWYWGTSLSTFSQLAFEARQWQLPLAIIFVLNCELDSPSYPIGSLKTASFFLFFDKMRIFIAFEGSFEPFDISADETVEAVKLMIKVHTLSLSP